MEERDLGFGISLSVPDTRRRPHIAVVRNFS